MSIYPEYPLVKEDPIFGIVEQFLSDRRETKVDLTIGILKNENLNPYLLHSVELAEEKIFQKRQAKTYLPILGNAQYIHFMKQCAFGEKTASELDDSFFGMQTIGGTGALYMACKLLRLSGTQSILLSKPTWPNHSKIATSLGYKVEFFPYYNMQEHTVDFSAMASYLRKSPSGSIIIFQPSCHNPTGADLLEEQWRILADIVQEKKLTVIFDMAYQGLGRGLEQDAYPIRLFVSLSIECIVAMSSAKNFGLYGERPGALFFFIRESSKKRAIASVAKSMVRENYSNPPRHGAGIVAEILSSPDLQQLWQKELWSMQSRIQATRDSLAVSFSQCTGHSKFSYLRRQFGLFSCLGCSPDEAACLQKEYGIYITMEGRINVTGLNSKNIPYVVEAVSKVMR